MESIEMTVVEVILASMEGYVNSPDHRALFNRLKKEVSTLQGKNKCLQAENEMLLEKVNNGLLY